MIGESHSTGQAAVLAVVVLYGMRAADSPACGALRRSGLPTLVWDNSADSIDLPADGQTMYRGDPTNPGLAAAYNAALRLAEERGIPWLLLLDQDTRVTPEFLREVHAATALAAPVTVAFVPLLRHRGAIVSPVSPRLLGPHRPYLPGMPLQAFNSGATVRVAAMRALGGFDRRFPLDYLDHATFAALQRNGSGVQVLRSTLDHPLSTDTGGSLTPAHRERQRSILAAERRFYRLHGSRLERVLFPLRLLRRAASVVVHKRDWQSAAQLLRVAVRPWSKA